MTLWISKVLIQKLTDSLKKTARQHMRNSISQVDVATENDTPSRVLGYCSITLRTPLPTSELPLEFQERLPHNVPAYTLGRLAVATERQRQGIGALLLVHGMKLVRHAADSVGEWGMFVDAKDTSAARYYCQFGFVPLPSNPLILFVPVASLPS